jgi:DNA polymerase-3 subunit delta'
MGVDEAREFKEEQGRRAFGGTEKFSVIGGGSITREAQNALLKVFEEPTKGTYIFLIVPNARQILPTLLSRVRVIKVPSTKYRVPNEEATIFLKTSVEKRLQLVFVKKITEEKDKQALISFFNEIESFLHDNFPVEKADKNTREFFDELIKLRGYAGDRSSSVKMLLEHIALIAPVIAKD